MIILGQEPAVRRLRAARAGRYGPADRALAVVPADLLKQARRFTGAYRRVAVPALGYPLARRLEVVDQVGIAPVPSQLVKLPPVVTASPASAPGSPCSARRGWPRSARPRRC